MRLNKEKIIALIIKVIYIFVIFGFIFPKVGNLVDNYLIFILFFLNLFIYLSYNVKVKRVYCIFIVPIIILIILFSVLSLSGIGSYMNFLNLIIMTIVTQKAKFKEKDYKAITVLSLILLIVLCVKSTFVWKNFELNKEDTNPNVLAQSIVLCFGIVCTGINQILDNSRSKKIILIINIIVVCSVYLCNSRNALVTILVFSISLFFENIEKIINRHLKKILVAIIIAGIIIPIMYVLMNDNNVEIEIFIINKSFFTGRETLWKNMIDSLNEKKVGYLIGLGSHNETKIGIIKNTHSWYLGMVYLFGIPMTIFYYAFLINNFKNIKSNFIKISIISVFLIGIFETSALWTNSQFLIFILLLLDNYYNGKKENTNARK